LVTPAGAAPAAASFARPPQNRPPPSLPPPSARVDAHLVGRAPPDSDQQLLKNFSFFPHLQPDVFNSQ
jgi:hypothetical protein